MRGAWVVVVVVVALAACSSSTAPVARPAARDDALDLFAYVPADTPYLWARVTRAPAARDVLPDWWGRADRAIAELAVKPARTPAERVLHALLAAHPGASLAEIFADLGIDPGARATLHGHGPWPVFRIELADGVRLRAVIGQILDELGVDLAVTRIGDADVVRLDGDDHLGVIVALSPHHAVIALAPAEVTTEELLAPAAEPISIDGLYTDAAARIGADPLSVGFVDVAPVASEIIARLPAERRACVAQIGALLQHVPRLLYASAAPSTDLTRIELVIELDDDAREALAAIRGEIPHWPARRSPGVLLDVGIGLDVGAAVAAGTDLVEHALTSPACLGLGGNPATFAQVRAIASSLTGIVRGGSVTVVPTDQDHEHAMVFAVATMDSTALLRTIEQLFGQLPVQSTPTVGGPPVELALRSGHPAYLALTSGALIVGLSEPSLDALPDPSDPPRRDVFAVMRLDTARAMFDASVEDHARRGGPPPDQADFAAYGETTIEARLTARGIEIDLTQRYDLASSR